SEASENALVGHLSRHKGPGSGSAAQDEISFLSWNSKDLKKQKPVISFSDSVRRRSSVLQWDPDVATQLVVASDEDSSPSVRLWDMRNIMTPVKEFTGHTKAMQYIYFQFPIYNYQNFTFVLHDVEYYHRLSSSRPRILIVKCNNSGQIEGSGGNLKDALAGMVDKQVGELLNREENRVLLDGLDKASQRVEMAKKELAEIEKQYFRRSR
ncbi:protein transport protein sec31 like protein b, partial [Quercus suber]